MAGTSVAERVAEVLPALYAITTSEQFPARALTLVRRAVGGDKGTYTEVDLRSGDFRAFVDPQPPVLRTLAPARAAYMHQHPVLRHFLRRPGSDARLISDFLTRREFHRLPVYGEFFAHLGVEDQITVLTSRPGSAELAGVSIERDRASFQEDERRVLEGLRPHLVTARSNAIRFSEALGQVPRGESGDTARLERLTDRQREILAQLAAGRTNAQIAYALGISVGTTRKHVEHILRRLELPTRTGAAVLYITATAPTAAPPWSASLPALLATGP